MRTARIQGTGRPDLRDNFGSETMARIREVRKRDSRIVPFDETKIADAVYAAFRSVGEGDRARANELAAAVTHFLERKFTGSIPGIEDIQDVVETVLIETGQTRVAKAYILYRQKRAMQRESLQVRKVAPLGEEESERIDGGEEGPGPGPEGPYPEVDQSIEGVSRWQKSKIVAALIREADLDPTVAEEVASSVERKVLGSGIHRISTTLIRELVDNELFERGYGASLQKQASISIPKYNLEQIIFGTDLKEGFAFPKTPIEVRNIVANRILHQYSLQEVLTPGVSNAHNDGRIFVHRLSDPIRLSRLHWALPVPACVRSSREGRGGPELGPASYLDLGDFFRKLWHLAHFFSEEIRISGLSSVLLDPGFRTRPTEERVRSVLDRLAQMESRPDIALELDLAPESLPWVEGLCDLARHSPRRFVLAFRVRGEAFRSEVGEAVLHGIAELYGRGERVHFLPAQASAKPGDGRAGTEGEGRLEAYAAKISVNLPRAAFRSGRDRRNSIEAEIESVLDLVIKGHLERRRFLERLCANRENPLWELCGKGSETPLVRTEDMSFAVGLIGLNECVKYLTGSEIHQDAGASRFGLDLVRSIHRKVRREERSLGLALVLEETANVGPLRVLERADRRRCPQMQEIDRGRDPRWGPAYTSGLRIHRMAPVDPLRRIEDLAQYSRIVGTDGGIVEDLPELRASPQDLLVSLLEESAPLVGGAADVAAGDSRRGAATLIESRKGPIESRREREEKG